MRDQIFAAIRNIPLRGPMDLENLGYLSQLASLRDLAPLAEALNRGFGFTPEITVAELSADNNELAAQICQRATFRYYQYYIEVVSDRNEAEEKNKRAALLMIADEPEALIRSPHPASSLRLLKARLSDAQESLMPMGGRIDLRVLNGDHFKELRQIATEQYVALILKDLPQANLLEILEAKTAPDFRKALGRVNHPVHGRLQFDDVEKETQLSNEQCRILMGYGKRTLMKSQPSIVWQTRHKLYASEVANSPGVKEVEFDVAMEDYRRGLIEPAEFKEEVVPSLVGFLKGDPEQVEAAKQTAKSDKTNGKNTKHSVELPGRIQLTETWLSENKIKLKLTSGIESSPEKIFGLMAKNLSLRFSKVMGMDLRDHELRFSEMPTLKDKQGKVIPWTDEYKQILEKSLNDVGFVNVILPEIADVDMDVENSLIPDLT